ncbi:methyltransferase domain-containing protein [Glycomyces sp. NPDC046736]|uniref:methyltransferase domain-containing protein n=1 Tax=Glycomyces sp. NPDC046736 TaxID=3155615 RepID=UPI00340AB7F3
MTPDALAELLGGTGAITSPSVYDAFSRVDRHAFVPECWVRDATGVNTFLSDSTDLDTRRAWLEVVYSDAALVTKVDERGIALSSSSQPTIMARMLEALDLKPGQRVLEIGTGTGYNTALLSKIAGGGQVFSIDIDPALVERARKVLAEQGHHPALTVGDGREGWAAGGPYDRLIATCETSTIPPAWLAQCRTRARMVVNIGYGSAVLTKNADGGAQGRYLEGVAAFMPARDTAQGPAPTTGLNLDALTDTPGATAEVPEQVHGRPFHMFLHTVRPDLIQLQLDTSRSAFGDTQGRQVVVSTDATRGSADLWNTIQGEYMRWRAWGHPELHHLTITVEPDGATRFEPDANL